MNDAVLGIPLREDMDQAALRQFAPAGMLRQECHPEPGNRRVAKGEEINASQARFVADRTLCAILPGEPERAGRWWWEDQSSQECGLHVKRD